MKKVIRVMVSLALMLALAGCGMSKQSIGVLTGGAIGGALGSQFGAGSGRILATVGGTVLGAFLGGAIGRTMDKVDRMQMNRTLEDNRNNQPHRWVNPNTGNRYTVTPTRTFYKSPTQPCRDFTTRAIIGGKTQTVYGEACRMDDGTWKIVQK